MGVKSEFVVFKQCRNLSSMKVLLSRHLGIFKCNSDCCDKLLGVRYIATTPLVDVKCEFGVFFTM